MRYTIHELTIRHLLHLNSLHGMTDSEERAVGFCSVDLVN